MRPTTKAKRGISERAVLPALAVLLLLTGCQTLEGVRRSILPDREQAQKTAEEDPSRGEKSAPRVDPVAASPWRLEEPLQAKPAGKLDTEFKPSQTDSASNALGARGRLSTFRYGGRRILLKPPPGTPRLVQVAILLPLTGPNAGLGESLLNAAQMALFAVGDDSLTLAPVDTKGTAEGAAAATRAAIDDGARLILGPVFSTSVAAAAPIARARGIQIVSFSNDRSVAGNGVYVMGFAPETQIRRVLAFAGSRGVKKIAAVAPQGPYGDRVEAILRALAPRLGMELKAVVRPSTYSTEALTPVVKHLANYEARRAVLLARRKELEGQTDEASKRALKRLENRDTLGDVDFDAVFLPQGGAELRALAPLLAYYDIDPRKVRMLGSIGWDSPIIATEPAVFGGWFPAPPPANRRAFEAAYEKNFGEKPARLASLGYDAMALAAVLARRAAQPPDPSPARVAGPLSAAAVSEGERVFTADSLTAANGFAGVDGIFRILPSGLVERGLAVIEIKPRRFEVVSPAPKAFQRLTN